MAVRQNRREERHHEKVIRHDKRRDEEAGGAQRGSGRGHIACKCCGGSQGGHEHRGAGALQSIAHCVVKGGVAVRESLFVEQGRACC